jgi:hypothetical protein
MASDRQHENPVDDDLMPGRVGGEKKASAINVFLSGKMQ